MHSFTLSHWLRVCLLHTIVSISTLEIQAASGVESSSRLVVTFQTASDNTVNGVDLSGAVVVKQYSRRLVLDLGEPFHLEEKQKYFKTMLRSVQSVEIDHLVGLQMTDDSIQTAVQSSDFLGATEMNNTYQNSDRAYVSPDTQTPLWNLMDSEPFSIHVEGIWPATNSTPDVVVAVIDTGIAQPAKELFRNLLDGYDFISDEGISIDWDGRDPDATDPGDWGDMCPDSSWHGTRVSSILAAKHENEFGMKGVAQNCSLLPIRVLGLCRMGYATDVTDAIVWAAGGAINGISTNPNPAKIISLSLSGQGECPDYLQSAVNQAIASDIIVVAAAGNNNQNVSGYFPANCKGVIAVSASTREGKLAGYSNWGNLISISAPGGDSVNAIMTISVDEMESGLEVSYSMGTSFAAPHVAGIIALIRVDTEHTMSEYFEIYKSTILNYMAAVHETCVGNNCAGVIISPKGLNISRVYASACQVDWDTQECSSCSGSCTCPDGYKYYYELIGASSYEGCVPCTEGTGNYPPYKTCPAGGYFPSATGSMDSTQWCSCTLCVLGDYCAGDLAPRIDCPAGMYCAVASTQTICPKGSYCPARSVSATQCPLGTYSGVTGASVCTTCSEVMYNTAIGLTTCLSCPAGTYSTAIKRTACTNQFTWNASNYPGITPAAAATTTNGVKAASSSWLLPINGVSVTWSSWSCCSPTSTGGVWYLISGNNNPATGETFMQPIWAPVSFTYITFTSGISNDFYFPSISRNMGFISFELVCGTQSCPSANVSFGVDLNGNGNIGGGAQAASLAERGCGMSIGSSSGKVISADGTQTSYAGNVLTGSRWYRMRLLIDIQAETMRIDSYTLYSITPSSVYNLQWIPQISGVNANFNWTETTGQNPALWSGVMFAACKDSVRVPWFMFTTYPVIGTVFNSISFTLQTCEVGTFWVNSSFCQKCPAGSYSSSTGVSFCITCSKGSYLSTEGSTSAAECTSCEAGTFGSSIGLPLCIPCSMGNYSGSIGATACMKCNAGKYADAISSSACSTCQPGTYSSTESSIACAACGAGKYTSTVARIECSDCTAGTYSSTSSGSVCSACVAGEYSSGVATSACSDCPAGTYSSTPSTSLCSACTLGTYTPTTRASICTPCPSCTQNGHYMANCTGTSPGTCTKCVNT